MKKICLFLLVFVLLASCLTVHATAPRLVDDADLLTDYGEQIITEKLDAVSAKYNIDVVIVTVDTIDGKSPMVYADDYYDYHDYSADGVILLISMEDRDWWISATGSCVAPINGSAISYFGDSAISYIGDQFVSYLSEGKYGEGMIAFTEEIDKCLAAWNGPHEPLGLGAIIACGIIAFLFGLIVIGSMKKKMKSVAYQRAATQYVRPGSLNVTLAQDFFLYRTVTRVARPKESSSSGGSSHTSSSGRSHGGGGGRF